MRPTAVIVTGLALGLSAVGCAHQSAGEHAGWQREFGVAKRALASSGRGTYFTLEPGTRATYEGVEDGEPHRLIITVLNRTKPVDGVETRIVEEREWVAGKLEEVSRNYFALDRATGDVYYFGEDVDMYKDGHVSNHEGSWQSGVKGARFGLGMPGSPYVGQRYYQEVAPSQAMDRAEIVSTTTSVTCPAGEFHNCVRTEETSPLEPGTKEYKAYAPGVGLVVDGTLKLVKVETGTR